MLDKSLTLICGNILRAVMLELHSYHTGSVL